MVLLLLYSKDNTPILAIIFINWRPAANSARSLEFGTVLDGEVLFTAMQVLPGYMKSGKDRSVSCNRLLISRAVLDHPQLSRCEGKIAASSSGAIVV